MAGILLTLIELNELIVRTGSEIMKNKVLFYIGSMLLIIGCGGSSNDCPNGINTTHPNCAGYIAPQQQYPQQTCQPGTPNCVNGYYQNPQQTCQPGTPNCVNGYYQYPQQPNTGYPQQYPYGYQQPYTGYPQQQYPNGYQQPYPYR